MAHGDGFELVWGFLVGKWRASRSIVFSVWNVEVGGCNLSGLGCFGSVIVGCVACQRVYAGCCYFKHAFKNVAHW